MAKSLKSLEFVRCLMVLIIDKSCNSRGFTIYQKNDNEQSVVVSKSSNENLKEDLSQFQKSFGLVCHIDLKMKFYYFLLQNITLVLILFYKNLIC